jgi:hypothetical protein
VLTIIRKTPARGGVTRTASGRVTKLTAVAAICLGLSLPRPQAAFGTVTISTQPEPQAVPVGYPVYFAVEASGAGPLTYTWRRNGVAISGAANTNFYNTPPVAAGDNNAIYTVVVTDSSGSVTSGGNGVLSVLPAVPNVFTLPPFYSCSVNYYVATNGNDAYTAAQAQNPNTPWKTIGNALTFLQNQGGTHGGVCVNVGSGIYPERIFSTVSGTSDTTNGYFVLRSRIPHGARIQLPANAPDWSYGIQFQNTRYVVIDGFVVAGDHTQSNINGSGIEVSGTNTAVCLGHHYRIYNNLIYGFGGAAISVSHADYVEERNNVCFSCCATENAGSSGIDDYEPVALDSGKWNTVSAANAAFHILVGDNISFNNLECNFGNPHYDGNGIIFDNFVVNQYTNETLVEGNLCFKNGGSGMALGGEFGGGSQVTIRNNTFFNNHGDDNHHSTWRGEITIANSHDITVANNIARAVVGTGAYTKSNTAIADVAGSGQTNQNDVYLNNLTYDGAPGDGSTNLQNTTATVSSANGNILGTDPQFGSETDFNFTLQSFSRAIDSGTAAAGFPLLDLNDLPRPQGAAIDLGAYEYGYSLRINSLARVGTNILISFVMGPGHTNALQATGGGNGISSTNRFTDIFVVTNNPGAGAVTNFLDVGAAAKFPSRFYRVQLVH